MAWGLGCQMTALNYQTVGTPMALQDAMFSRNGRCGYALKPFFMRTLAHEVVEEYHPQTYTPHNLSLLVRVISAMNLPKENGDKHGEVIDPSVSLELHCSTGTVQSRKTDAIRKNGYNPVWNELFEFKVKHLELSFLTMTVYDIDWLQPDYIAHAGISVKHIREGYRFVPLINADGHYIPEAGLFCHFKIEQSLSAGFDAPPSHLSGSQRRKRRMDSRNRSMSQESTRSADLVSVHQMPNLSTPKSPNARAVAQLNAV